MSYLLTMSFMMDKRKEKYEKIYRNVGADGGVLSRIAIGACVVAKAIQEMP